MDELKVVFEEVSVDELYDDFANFLNGATIFILGVGVGAVVT